MIKRYIASAALIAAGMLVVSPANATTVNLATSDSGTVVNSYGTAQFDFMKQQPTGTGYIDPFLRVQNTPTEQGYNTSGGTPFDDKAGPWTHDIKFSDLQSTTVTMNGATYFKVMLDANEPNGGKSIITLDSLQFYTSSQGSLTTTNISELGVLRYDLDQGQDSSVIIDAGRNHGSGSGDVYMYIPTTAFNGVSANDYVYMYVAFGQADNDAAGGFEEFTLVRNIAPVPEMSALFPIVGLLVAVGCTHILRRRQLARVSA